MIRRISVRWPDDRPFRAREGRSIRLLAASDMREPAMEIEANRRAIAPVDGVIGCGDLDPHWLAFLADAFGAPLVYVRGNHDHGGDWDEHDSVVPESLGSGAVTHLAGIVIGGLEWPAGDRGNRRRPDLAWWQALRLALRRARSGVGRWSEPMVVISHAAPEGAGDVPTELYHRGFRAYRWLLDRFRPPLWLHGHTTTASVADLQVAAGTTTVVNVTGAVLIELLPPAGA